jgi:hypothetical protein
MKYILKDNAEQILELGLDAMTNACESLKEICSIQEDQIDELTAKVAQLQDRLLIDREERE